MRKHLSVLALAARGTVCRVLLITVLAAVAAGALLWLVPAQEHVGSVMGADGTETALYQPCAFSALPAKTGATAVCAAGFAAVLAVLSLNGCGYGAHTGLTVGRLRIREGAFCTWWAVYSGVCLLFYWAVMAAVFPAVLQARMAVWTLPPYYWEAYTVGRQTMLLTVYSGSFLHHLLPVRDALVWVENGLLTVLCAMAAAPTRTATPSCATSSPRPRATTCPTTTSSAPSRRPPASWAMWITRPSTTKAMLPAAWL